MVQACDLHIHSNFSDGTCSPAELIDIAQMLGLQAVALCDHNTVAGLPDFLEAARGREVEAVPGIEFSADYGGTEVHILGLFIQPERYADVTALLDEMLRKKDESNAALCRKLTAAGFPLDYAAIKSATPAGQVNRAVIAAEMVRLGYCASVKEAFSTRLSVRHGYYVPPARPDALRVIRFIKSIGSVAVLAHPFLNLDEERLRVFLPRAKDAGLDGMEVYYPLFDKKTTQLAVALAEMFDLLPSGGSDFHGANKPDIQMGTGRGNLHIPRKLLDQLSACRKDLAQIDGAVQYGVSGNGL